MGDKLVRLFEFTEVLSVDNFYLFNRENDVELVSLLNLSEYDFFLIEDLSLTKDSEIVKRHLIRSHIRFSETVLKNNLILGGKNYGKKILIVPAEDLHRIHSPVERDTYDPVQQDFSIEELAAFIKKNCKQYLAQNPDLLPLFRGSDYRQNLELVFIKKVRPNRNSKDVNPSTNRKINTMLTKKGLIANRNNSIFSIGTRTNVDGKKTHISEYGAPWVIFPMGNFNYTWSPKIKDLVRKEIVGVATALKFAETYQGDDGSLVQAIQSKCEIMINCDKVLYVSPKLMPKLMALLK